MEPVKIVLIAVGLIGFFVAFILQFRLRHHVSAERVQELLNTPAELYPNSIPPRRVLDDRGRELHRIMMMGGTIFVVALVGLFLIQKGLLP